MNKRTERELRIRPVELYRDSDLLDEPCVKHRCDNHIWFTNCEL